MAYAAMLIGFARAIFVVLDQGRIIDTIVNALVTPLQSLPVTLSALGMMIVQAAVHGPVPSVSGQAVLTMPVLVPMSDLIGLSRQVVVLAYPVRRRPDRAADADQRRVDGGHCRRRRQVWRLAQVRCSAVRRAPRARRGRDRRGDCDRSVTRDSRFAVRGVAGGSPQLTTFTVTLVRCRNRQQEKRERSFSLFSFLLLDLEWNVARL